MLAPWYGEAVCFNKDGEPAPCRGTLVTSVETSRSIDEYCGPLGIHCTDTELREAEKALAR